jgi:hypothetical protein
MCECKMCAARTLILELSALLSWRGAQKDFPGARAVAIRKFLSHRELSALHFQIQMNYNICREWVRARKPSDLHCASLWVCWLVGKKERDRAPVWSVILIKTLWGAANSQRDTRNFFCLISRCCCWPTHYLNNSMRPATKFFIGMLESYLFAHWVWNFGIVSNLFWYLV